MSETFEKMVTRIKEEVCLERTKSNNPNATHWEFEPFRRLAAELSKDREPIGEVRESGVYWFGQNPHAFPIGTRFCTCPTPARSDHGQDRTCPACNSPQLCEDNGPACKQEKNDG